MTRRSLVFLLSIAMLGSLPAAAATGSDEEELSILESDADYDGVVDHTKQPDPRQVKKLVGYILDGMNHADSLDRQRLRLIERLLNRYNRRRKKIEL
jgi:hypothetical protein